MTYEKILVVDNRPLALERAHRALVEDYTLTFLTNYPDALPTIETWQPNVLVIGFHTPEIVDFLNAFTRTDISRDVRILCVLPAPLELTRPAAQWINLYICLPYDPRELLMDVRELERRDTEAATRGDG